MSATNSRLAKLEKQLHNEPIKFVIVWDGDELPEDGTPVIRLTWDDPEPLWGSDEVSQ